MTPSLSEIRKHLMLDGFHCKMCERKKTLYTSSYGIEITIFEVTPISAVVEVLEPVSESFASVTIEINTV
jgi:hypothetical protein